MNITSAERRIDQIMTDPAASKRLKSWLASAMIDDPVDAANDAEVMSILLNRRVGDIIGIQTTHDTCLQELLAALKGVLPCVPGFISGDDAGRPWIKAACDAIARAEQVA